MNRDPLEQARKEGRVVETKVNPAAFEKMQFRSPGETGHKTVYTLDQTILNQMTEAEFQTEVVNLAHDFGWKAGHFRKVRVQRKDGTTYWETPVAADGKGFPDLILAKDGCRLIFPELKVGNNTPTVEQWEWIHLLRSTGANAPVWYPSDWQIIINTLSLNRPPESHSIAQELHRLADDGCPHND